MKLMHDDGKAIYAKGLANHRQFDNRFYMSFNKIVIAEFLQVEEQMDEKDAFVNPYNYEREHGGINGMTPAEKFMECLNQPILTH